MLNRKQYHGDQFFVQLDDWVVDILASDKLTKADHRLFWYLFKLDRWGNRFVTLPSQSQIALALGVSRQTVNQSQGRLQELKLWDFKVTEWKARNLVGPKSNSVSEKSDTLLDNFDTVSEKSDDSLYEKSDKVSEKFDIMSEESDSDIYYIDRARAQINTDNKQTVRKEEEADSATTTVVAEVVEVFSEEVNRSLEVEQQRLESKTDEEPIDQGMEHLSAADPQILKEIEQITYDWRKRPWMGSHNSFKPEVIQAVWRCNADWYSLEGSKTPNLKKIGDRLRRLDGQLKKLDAEAVAAYSELRNYWTTAQAITNPDTEQAFNQAAIKQKQQQTFTSVERALDKPEGAIW